jgi:hypothetical protein
MRVAQLSSEVRRSLFVNLVNQIQADRAIERPGTLPYPSCVVLN